MKKKILLIALSFASLSCFAATLADQQANMAASFEGVLNLIQPMAYLMGLIMGMSGLVSMKRHTESQGRGGSLSSGVAKIMVAAGLMALPTFMNSATSTLMNPATQTASVQQRSPAKTAPSIAPVAQSAQPNPAVKKDVSPEGWDAKVGNSAWSLPPQN